MNERVIEGLRTFSGMKKIHCVRSAGLDVRTELFEGIVMRKGTYGVDLQIREEEHEVRC